MPLQKLGVPLGLGAAAVEAQFGADQPQPPGHQVDEGAVPDIAGKGHPLPRQAGDGGGHLVGLQVDVVLGKAAALYAGTAGTGGEIAHRQIGVGVLGVDGHQQGGKHGRGPPHLSKIDSGRRASGAPLPALSIVPLAGSEVMARRPLEGPPKTKMRIVIIFFAKPIDVSGCSWYS